MRISDWSSDVCSSYLDAVLHHQVRGSHAGKQRDLLVPVLDRVPGAELERPAPVLHAHFLLRQRQADAAAALLAPDAQLADLAQHREHRIGVAGVDACLHAGRSEEHTSELPSLMRISYARFLLKK